MGKLLLVLFLAAQAMAGSFKLLEDTLDLGVGSYRYIKFRITPDQSVDAVISGSIGTVPDSTDVELILLTEWNYLTGWVNRGEVDTLGLRRDGPGQVLIDIPDFGDYVLVVSNRGNAVPVSVLTDLRVSFEGTGITYDTLPVGVTLLVTVFAAALVIAAAVITIRKLG